MTKRNKITKGALLGTAYAALFAPVTVANAQDYTSVYNPVINFDEWMDIEAEAELDVEGALGALNTGFTQTAIIQLNAAAARITADLARTDDNEPLTGTGFFLDLAQDTGSSNEGIQLEIDQRATAFTRQLDAVLGGSQIGSIAFNTASVDVVGGDDGEMGLIGLNQILDGDTIDNGEGSIEPFTFLLEIDNEMEVASSYAGTARLDGLTPKTIANPDYDPDVEGSLENIVVEGEFVNSVQQAAIAVNTLRVTSEVDTLIDLGSQGFDVRAFSGREDSPAGGEDYEQEFALDVSNVALSYSPRPATAEFVDPRLVSALNDPSIANLDQVAVINLNTMAFGTAATDEDEAGTEDYTVLVDTNYGFSGEAQHAGFNDNDNNFEDWYGDTDQGRQELELGNVMLATTNPLVYALAGGNTDMIDDAWDERSGIGDVALDNVSQTAALTMNSIRQNGDGDLILKAGYFEESGDSEEYTNDDFEQSVTDLKLTLSEDMLEEMDFGDFGPDVLDVFDNIPEDVMLAPAVNFSAAITHDGDIGINSLTQTFALSGNSIASGGGVIGWNDAGGEEIEQGHLNEEGVPEIRFEYLNAVKTAWGPFEADGDINAADINQLAQITWNTLSAGTNIEANLSQDALVEIEAWDDWNDVDLHVDVGSIELDGLSQVASARLNSVSAGEEISSSLLRQSYESEYFLDFEEGMNDLDMHTDVGDVSASNIEQVAQLTLNTVSAGSLDVGYDDDEYEAGVVQYVGDFGYDNVIDGEANDIELHADDAGNASLTDGSQVFVLNVNTISAEDSASGRFEQTLHDFDADWGSYDENDVHVHADQDIAGLRNVGGNASIDGLTQTLAANFNTFSAGMLDNANITQELDWFDAELENDVSVDSEWGVASAEDVAQTVIVRVNTLSISQD